MENLAHLGLPGGVNPLDFLHKLAMQRGLPRPQFQQLGEQGPPHMKVFVWLCNFNNISAQGSGRSKKEAKVAAARAVRDQINYEALPSAPTFQSQMLERKRKQEEELQDSSVKKEPDETKVKTEGNGESATASSSENQQQPKKKAKKGYDYNRHFQCYGTNPGAGPGGPPPLMGMGMPYGYLPEQNMPPHFGGGGGFGGNFGPPGPPFGFDGPPNMMIGMMGGGYDEYQPPEGFGPQVIDPHGFDPFSEGGGGAPGMEDAGPGTGFPVNEMGYALGSMFQGGFGNDMSGGEAVGFHSNMGGGAGYGPGGGGGFNSRLSKLDRYVIKKHTDVYPSEKDLDLVLKLVTDIEETMRSLSNDWNTDEENSVKIEGLVRVGDLAKGLLLASDRVVNVVVLCRSAPTKDMLQKIHTLISTKIKEANAKYETKVSEEYASLEISTKHNIDEQDPDQTSTLTTDLFYCNVIFTSTKLRKKPPMTASATKEEEPEAEEEESKEQEDDVKVEGMLPKDKCLQALAELRRARWFSAMAANIPSCVECIRIVKDLARRDPVWLPLTDWTIELLVERSLYSAFRALNPAASLMRVMEVVASGILLSNDHGLKDPCEREDVDLASKLEVQEREDITRSAQEYLRHMHFRKIFKVLGLDEDAVLDESKANKVANDEPPEKEEAVKKEPVPKEDEKQNQNGATTASENSKATS